jgi:hypothetical protein
MGTPNDGTGRISRSPVEGSMHLGLGEWVAVALALRIVLSISYVRYGRAL